MELEHLLSDSVIDQVMATAQVAHHLTRVERSQTTGMTGTTPFRNTRAFTAILTVTVQTASYTQSLMAFIYPIAYRVQRSATARAATTGRTVTTGRITRKKNGHRGQWQCIIPHHELNVSHVYHVEWFHLWGIGSGGG